MYSPYSSRHFTTHIDPVSGTKIAVLSTHVAPVQKAFYFINSSWSDDGRYMWFHCAFPPAGPARQCLAVIDFLTDEIHRFPEASGLDLGGPLVDSKTGDVYLGLASGIYKRSPNPADKIVQIAKMPKYLVDMGARTCGTHLTFTPDRQELLVDIQTSEGSVIGTFNIMTGEFSEWYRTQPEIPYNHGQLNPVDGNVCMCAHEFGWNPEEKEDCPPAFVDGIYPRLQIITRDGKRTMLKPYKNFGGHEFWAPDGKSIYYQNSAYRAFKSKKLYGSEVGTLLHDKLDGSDPEVICEVDLPGGAGVWHAHCSKDQKYFVMDGAYATGEFPLWRGCETCVHFFNKETGKLFKFLTKNPVVEGWSLENQCPYHIDPHPRFVLDDTMITFTTTICGRVDAAVVSVDQLIEATK